MVKKGAAAMGWTGKEWDALDAVIMKESGYNPAAANKKSSARGIGQTMMSVHFGKGWKNSPAAQKFLGDPKAQVAWTLRYVRNRYGTPSKALEHHERHGWY